MVLILTLDDSVEQNRRDRRQGSTAGNGVHQSEVAVVRCLSTRVVAVLMQAHIVERHFRRRVQRVQAHVLLARAVQENADAQHSATQHYQPRVLHRWPHRPDEIMVSEAL